jgi:hypothetical protein
MLTPALEIIKTTFRLYAKNWRSILPYSALIFVPAAILALLGVGSVYLSTILPTSDLVNNIVISLLSVGSWFISFWAMLALARATKDMIDGQNILPWKEGLSATGNRALPVLWVSIITSIIVGLWTLLLIIPGIIFSMYYVFSSYVTLFEGIKGRAALKYSKALVKGRWWSVAWRVGVVGLFFGLLVSLVVFVLSAPFTILLSMSHPTVDVVQEAGRTLSTTEVLATMLAGLMSSLGSALAAPLATISLVLIYFNVKNTPVTPAPETSQKM